MHNLQKHLKFYEWNYSCPLFWSLLRRMCQDLVEILFKINDTSISGLRRCFLCKLIIIHDRHSLSQSVNRKVSICEIFEVKSCITVSGICHAYFANSNYYTIFVNIYLVDTYSVSRLRINGLDILAHDVCRVWRKLSKGWRNYECVESKLYVLRWEMLPSNSIKFLFSVKETFQTFDLKYFTEI